MKQSLIYFLIFVTLGLFISSTYYFVHRWENEQKMNLITN